MKETLSFSLSVFAVSVEPAVQKADPLVQDVLVLRHHPVSHHPLLPDETLKLYSSEASEPHGPFDQVFWVGFKITCSQTQAAQRYTTVCENFPIQMVVQK